MSDSLPWFKMYPRETLSDGHFSGWSLEERGAWMTLILHNWIEGSLPADQGALGRLLRLDGGTMRGVWSAIGSRFIPHPDLPGRLTSPRLEMERSEAIARLKKMSEAGTKAAKARWQREKQRHAKRIRSAYGKDAPAMRHDAASDPDPASDPATDSAASQPSQERLAGESVNLRAFRERLTAALQLPDLIPIAKRDEAQRVTAFFEAQLAAAGSDTLLADCLYLAGKSTTGRPGSLAWFVGWLKVYPTSTGATP
jgi:uncharacterized protein YdaU (DUF1376 family)